VHFHIIPRRPGEKLLMHAAVRVDPEQLREHAERIRRWL
jgi:diadenosine tetraphosphate (Ap4A) HIT family hydrolase